MTAINIESLKAKLLFLAKEQNIDFQVVLNRFGTEQFLARLSTSPLAEKFIFKGGSLLVYLIETHRHTRDIDFSIKEQPKQSNLLAMVQSILDISINDGIQWEPAKSEILDHPDLEEPGLRVICHFHLGKMRGQVHMDLAIGDVVQPVKISLPRIRYKGIPLIGEDFSLLSYPSESIFAEKLHIIISKRENNTRMKDYYDLAKLSQQISDYQKLRQAIEATFNNRRTLLIQSVTFDSNALEILQKQWHNFLTKENLDDVPKQIVDVISLINLALKKI